MSNDEFSDLEKFGKVIEKPPEKEKTRVKKKEKKNVQIDWGKITKSDLSKLFCFLRNIAVKIKQKFLKLISLIKTKREIRKRYKAIVKRNKNRKDIGYKIVETKKQRGNKTVIVRRRVPIYFDTSKLVAKPSSMGSIYYLRLDEESKNLENTVKHNSYDILKKSVWDFPIEDKSIFRRTANILKIQGLFKK